VAQPSGYFVICLSLVSEPELMPIPDVSVDETTDSHHVNVNIDPSSKRQLRPSYVRTWKLRV
jgi:hypothetical protein